MFKRAERQEKHSAVQIVQGFGLVLVSLVVAQTRDV